MIIPEENREFASRPCEEEERRLLTLYAKRGAEKRRKTAMMKALTIRQPFAHLIATGKKRIENRDWPTNHRGPLAIHAGTNRASLTELFEHRIKPEDVTYGAIIAVVNVVACVPVHSLPSEFKGDPANVGPWCWILSDVKPLAKPLPWRGQLGLWEVSAFLLDGK